jgi:hypothetical protein
MPESWIPDPSLSLSPSIAFLLRSIFLSGSACPGILSLVSSARSAYSMKEATMPMATVNKAPLLADIIEAAPSIVPFMLVPFISIPPAPAVVTGVVGSISSRFCESLDSLLASSRAVDDTNHAVLAMVCARAVVPQGLRGIGDVDHECLGRGTLLAGDETGPEAILHGGAGRGEGSLGDRVTLGPELEGDGVALGSGKVGRLEGQGSVSDDNGMVSGDSGASKRGGSGSEE